MLGQRFILGFLLAMLPTAANGQVILAAASEDTRLSDAAMRGDRNAVRSLLLQRVDVNGAQGDGSTALHWAAYRDDLEMARSLTDAGADLRAKTRLGEFTALSMAAKNGSAAMIEMLLEAGADPNAISTTGTTALMLAAASGRVEAVKTLLDHNANVNAKDLTNEQTALMFAAARNRAAAVKVLAEHGANLNATSKVNQIASKEKEGDSAERSGKDSDPTVMGGLTAFHFAAREGHFEAVQALVEAGADVDQVAASDNVSAMTMSIINANFDIGKLLLDHGANPNLVSSRGLNALYATLDAKYAAQTAYPPPSEAKQKTVHLDLLKALLNGGADPNVRMGPKLWFRGLDGGDWVDAHGATPFWRAAQANDIPAMRLLVAAGADPTTPTTGGVSPLQVAAGFGTEDRGTKFVPAARIEAIKYLVEELAADPKSRDENGFTPLHGAAFVGANEIILYLVGKGADPKARADKRLQVGATGAEVEKGDGETVADMANGPRQKSIVYPDTTAILDALGSENSNNCRASLCINANRVVRRQQ